MFRIRSAPREDAGFVSAIFDFEVFAVLGSPGDLGFRLAVFGGLFLGSHEMQGVRGFVGCGTGESNRREESGNQ